LTNPNWSGDVRLFVQAVDEYEYDTCFEITEEQLKTINICLN
jgi:hypothetical protein